MVCSILPLNMRAGIGTLASTRMLPCRTSSVPSILNPKVEKALNEQILNLRRGRPLSLEIRGRDRLYVEQEDVMLESAATSFQIHLKVAPAEAARLYNASKILSAPLVAIRST